MAAKATTSARTSNKTSKSKIMTAQQGAKAAKGICQTPYPAAGEDTLQKCIPFLLTLKNCEQTSLVLSKTISIEIYAITFSAF